MEKISSRRPYSFICEYGRPFITGAVDCYIVTIVPTFVPSVRALAALSRDVIMAFLPGFDSANLMAASTFGSIEPGAKCFSSMYCLASLIVITSRFFWSGLP